VCAVKVNAERLEKPKLTGDPDNLDQEGQTHVPHVGYGRKGTSSFFLISSQQGRHQE